MIPFSVLIVCFVVLSLTFRYSRLRLRFCLKDAAAYSLAVMLLLTATAHFNDQRADLIRMVPPIFPRADLLVTVTGVLEYLGALGLVWRQTRRIAGLSLAVFFIAVLPANIYAALEGLTLRGQPVTPLHIRVPMQFVFITFALWAAKSRLK